MSKSKICVAVALFLVYTASALTLALVGKNLTWQLGLLLALGQALLFFLLWLLFRAGVYVREKETELKRAAYMLGIKRLLFDAHRKPEQFKQALDKVAQELDAEKAFLITCSPGGESRFYVQRRKGTGGDETFGPISPKDAFPALTNRLKEQGKLLAYDLAQLLENAQEEYAALLSLGINSLMLLPLENFDNDYTGVLGAANMTRRWETAEVLESVVHGFSMAVNNREAFRLVHEMSAIDRLTGLKNRNSYQRALSEYERKNETGMACIFIDADGLHEINNHFGHISGDMMLKCVAEALKEQFGIEHSYRVGGDEFIAFVFGLDEDKIYERIDEMERQVEEKGYHISVGTAWRITTPLVYDMVKKAEQKMYQRKRLYYKSKDDSSHMREPNWKLEQILTEKRDLEVFRSVIASKYKGVYIVDLNMDTLRAIYIPPYFKRAIEIAGGKFSVAMKLYLEENVKPEYHEKILALLEYGKLEKAFEKGGAPALPFEKLDNSVLLLRVYQSPDYSELIRESIWSFEVFHKE